MNRGRLERGDGFPALANPAGVGDSRSGFPWVSLRFTHGYSWRTALRFNAPVCRCLRLRPGIFIPFVGCAVLLVGCCKHSANTGSSDAAAKPDPALVLKLEPGIYDAFDDPRWETLQKFTQQADINFLLSGHDGISCGDEGDLSSDDVRKVVSKLPRRRLAEIMLAKNYTDTTQHTDLKALLRDEGFEAVIILRAGGSFTGLVEYTNFSSTSATSRGQR